MFALVSVDSFDAILRKKTTLLKSVRGCSHNLLSETVQRVGTEWTVPTLCDQSDRRTDDQWIGHMT